MAEAARPRKAAARGGLFSSGVVVEGRGDETLVFVHGWPDDLRLWDAQVAALAPVFHCARFTLPGFAAGASGRARSLDEIVATLAAVVDAVSPERPVTLVLHDWGCFFGYRYAERHPGRVARIVAVDVGDAGSRAHRREIGWLGQALTAAYQLTLAAAWGVGGAVGDAVARALARLLRAPRAAGTRAAMGWPYAVQWFGTAGGFGRPRAFEPHCPMLYVHGARKPFAFHSKVWTDRIAARPGCRVVAMPTGHWVMRSRPADFNALLAGWLAATRATGVPRVDAGATADASA